MPHLKHETVDVTAELTVSYVSSTGSEWSDWNNSGTRLTPERVVDAIDHEIGRIDARRGALASARIGVVKSHATLPNVEPPDVIPCPYCVGGLIRMRAPQ